MAYSVADFVAEVDRVLNDKGETMEAVWAMDPPLKRLVAEGGDLTVQGLSLEDSAGPGARELHVDRQGRFGLFIARFAPDQPTPVHSHFRWGLECGISGRERNTVWSRVDDGSVPGRAKLEVFSAHHIEHGDLGFWYDPPRNIHRHWAVGEEPSSAVILVGGDGDAQYNFDLENGTFTGA
jgi:predicted metal-dependent enzyme (double-stranded beta helix superfamily)